MLYLNIPKSYFNLFSNYSLTHLPAFSINDTELVHSPSRMVTLHKKKIGIQRKFLRVYSNALHIPFQVHKSLVSTINDACMLCFILLILILILVILHTSTIYVGVPWVAPLAKLIIGWRKNPSRTLASLLLTKRYNKLFNSYTVKSIPVNGNITTALLLCAT